MFPPLAERLATELVDEIDQVAEPYRSNLLTWVEKMANSQLRAMRADSCPSMHHELTAWLSGFDTLGMIDQHQLLRLLCQDAARIFGKNGDGLD